jgi:outer membrane protein OmpA-like peptidoglycan-associated protein
MRILNCDGRCLGAGALLGLTVFACASQKTDARAPSADSAASASFDSAGDGETTVQISKTMRERCNLPAEPQTAPSFAYDESKLRTRGKTVLDDVAKCLTTGPLKGEVITLIGRADARGTEEYNSSLGASRASAARDYLFQHGVPADQMRLLSRGELGARGTDEQTHALDRRVDLELGDLRASPILKGTMMQVEASDARRPDPNNKAASYADVPEGGTRVETDNSSTTGDSTNGSATGSASGSVKAGTK